MAVINMPKPIISGRNNTTMANATNAKMASTIEYTLASYIAMDDATKIVDTFGD